MGSRIESGNFTPQNIPFAVHRAFLLWEASPQHPNNLKKLSSILRWEAQKPKSISSEYWEKTLGADIRDTTHLRLTYGISCFFLKHQKGASIQFTSEEEDIVKLLAITHDWPEAILGDVPAASKSEEDRTQERIQYGEIARVVLQTEPVLLEKVLEAGEHLNNPDTKVGRAFTVIEHIGYLRLCLLAGKKTDEISNKKGQKNEEFAIFFNLFNMGSRIAGEELKWLIKNGREYPAVQQFLKAWKMG